MSSINLTDQFKVHGSLQIIMTDKTTGEVLMDIEDDNLVVNGGRSGMAHLWAGYWFAGPPTGFVNEMRFGDRGHDTTDPTLPKSSSVERTQLFCEDEGRPIIISKKPLTVDFPDGDSGTTVRFTCTIDSTEGNGSGRQGFSEAGLYRDDGTLAAHKTFGLITKTNEFILTFRWRFRF